MPMLKYLAPRSAALLLLLLTGCLFRSSPETAYFDLAPAEPAVPQPDRTPVTVTDFRNRSGSGVRFQLRRGNRIEPDGANKWILPPGELLARGLAGSLAPQAGERRVGGILRQFEADLETGKFLLAGEYEIDGAAPAAFVYEETFGVDPTPEAIAAAAARAAQRLAADVNRALER